MVAKKHGLGASENRTKEYNAWLSMNKRCNNSADKEYKNYGGRGIQICERWREFNNFLADMGTAPDGLTLDRMDNNGNYSPENCRWATKKMQQRNRRSVTLLTHAGKTMCIAEWAEIVGIPPNLISSRLYRGWSLEKVLNTPKLSKYDHRREA